MGMTAARRSGPSSATDTCPILLSMSPKKIHKKLILSVNIDQEVICAVSNGNIADDLE